MFRDQSQEIAAKMQAESQSVKSKIVLRSRPSRSPTPRAARSSSATTGNASAMAHSPALDLENGWIDFFTNNFACSGTADSKSNVFWIPPNFEDLLKNDSARFSVQCVGAMAMARLQKSPCCLHEAQKKYSLALLRLAEIWQQNVANAQKDMIFLIVLLLSFYEVLATYEPSARKSWITHLGGLGVLFKNNEEYYSSTEFGARMFFHARSQITLVALQTKTPVADTFSKPNPRVLRSLPPQFKEFDESDMLCICLANLQARCRISGPLNSLLLELIALEKALRSWEASLPPSWVFSAKRHHGSPGMWWDVFHHTYSSPIIEHTCNKIRAAQIVVHDLIQDMMQQLNPKPGSPEPSLTEPKVLDPKVQQLVIDICSTVHPSFRPSSGVPGSNNVEPPPRLGTTYWLIWVLDVVASMHEAPPELTRWVIEIFDRVHDLGGNVRAYCIAKKLRMGLQSFPASLSYPDLLNLKK